MIITNKRTGEKREVTEAEAERIAANPQISRLYHTPLLNVKEPNVPKEKRKPLKLKPKNEEEIGSATDSADAAVTDDQSPTE